MTYTNLGKDTLLYDTDTDPRVIYRCYCGCNVFRQIVDSEHPAKLIYECNGCGDYVYAEKAQKIEQTDIQNERSIILLLWGALSVVLDQVDYTAGNCKPNEPVGGVLRKEVIILARTAIAKAEELGYATS